MLRDVAQGIADFIAQDPVLNERSHVSVVVEDKADVGYEVADAIAQTGVCVLVAVTGFRRVDNSPLLQGTAQFTVSCLEHPTLNRDDPSTLTAQGVAERLARILHYREFPFLANKIIFRDFSRDDVDEANIVRISFEANTLLGFEDAWLAEQQQNPQKE